MSFSRRELLKTATLAGIGSTLLPPVIWAAEPRVRPAPMMPAPSYVQTNGLSMAVYEQGDGPAIIFCHGFPELAFSWRHQLKAVSKAGYHAIAPDQRGYGLTGGPEEISSYRIDILCDDLVGMMDAKGIEKAVFVGHDWGGGIVWAMGFLHPERCLGIAALNTPAQRPQGLPPVERSEPSLIVPSPNYYVATFMPPGVAEGVLEADVKKSFEFMLSTGGIWDKTEFAKLPESSAERQMDLLGMLKRDNPPGEPFLPDEVMQYFVETFEVTGFSGGLNWYRATRLIGDAFANATTRIEVPCLYIGAEHDVILPPSSADGMEDFITDLEKHTVMGSGHWTQQEKPDEVNRVLVDWLERKIG